MKRVLVGLCLTTFLLSAHSFRLGGVVVRKRPPWSTTSTLCHVGTSLAMVHLDGEAASSPIMATFGSNNTTATATAAVSVSRRFNDSEAILKRTAASTTSSSSSSNNTSSSTTPAPASNQAPRKRAAVVKRVRKHAGVALASVGFASSATRAILANHQQQLSSLKPLVDSLVHFLRKSGIDLELSKSLNFRLLDNVIILTRVQKLLLQNVDIRDLVASSSTTASDSTTTISLDDNQANIKSPVGIGVVLPSNEEALRYMKYATAAYGDSMIRAANLDVKGDISSLSFFGMSGKLTKTRVSEHINVPEQDIVAMDVDYGGDTNHLRHFVAVDHVHRKVVLAIRGTFTISELVVDVAGFSRPFCGGEAHSEMANMAERVWRVSGPIVTELLKKNEGYHLILTGHSLGAGVACLLNILLDSAENNENVNGLLNVDGRQVKVQCFAYASPPVFAPKVQYENDDSKTGSTNTPTGTLELPKAALSCTNYIHEMDVVPFLSVDSIRHFFKCISVLEESHPHKWWSLPSWLLRTSRGARDFYRDPALLDAVQRARTERLHAKPGAPLLAVPAATNVWMMQHQRAADAGGAYYDQKRCDPIRLATLGIHMDFRMLQDHFPSRYEHALHHLL